MGFYVFLDAEGPQHSLLWHEECSGGLASLSSKIHCRFTKRRKDFAFAIAILRSLIIDNTYFSSFIMQQTPVYPIQRLNDHASPRDDSKNKQTMLNSRLPLAPILR